MATTNRNHHAMQQYRALAFRSAAGIVRKQDLESLYGDAVAEMIWEPGNEWLQEVLSKLQVAVTDELEALAAVAESKTDRR